MARNRRTHFLKNLSDETLNAELEAHLKRAARTSGDLMIYLSTQGSTWERTAIMLQELAGHVGRAIALCREGSRRKYVDAGHLKPES